MDDAIELKNALARAVFLAEHLMEMIPQQVWRDSGGDDQQGHYEGDYRAEQTALELRELKKLVPLHDPDCPMVNRDPAARTECVCDQTQWADPEHHTNRTVPEGGGDA